MVGFQIWTAQPGEGDLTLEHARSGVAAAIQRIGHLVHEPAIAELSAVDRHFLAAMAVDDGPSKMSDIAARMNVDGNYANQYRARLLATELITAPARGLVEFSILHLREYLRDRVHQGP